MSSTQVIIVLLGVSIILAVVGYLNLWIAKRKMYEWKSGSGHHFLLALVANVKISYTDWMQQFGYEQANASRLAKFAQIARLESWLCVVVWFLIASTLMKR